MANKGQKQKKYTEDFISKVVNDKIERGMSHSTLSRKYDVPEGTIMTWVSRFKRQGPTRKQRGRNKQSEETNYKEKYEILKKFLESLEGVEHEKK